jgi:hypothetical protein
VIATGPASRRLHVHDHGMPQQARSQWPASGCGARDERQGAVTGVRSGALDPQKMHDERHAANRAAPANAFPFGAERPLPLRIPISWRLSDPPFSRCGRLLPAVRTRRCTVVCTRRCRDVPRRSRTHQSQVLLQSRRHPPPQTHWRGLQGSASRPRCSRAPRTSRHPLQSQSMPCRSVFGRMSRSGRAQVRSAIAPSFPF